MDSMDWLYVVKVLQENMRHTHLNQNHKMRALPTVDPCDHLTCVRMQGIIEDIHANFIRPAAGSYPTDAIIDTRKSLTMLNSALALLVITLTERSVLLDHHQVELLKRLDEADGKIR